MPISSASTVEFECMVFLQASRRGELRELAGFVPVIHAISRRAREAAPPELSRKFRDLLSIAGSYGYKTTEWDS